MFAFFDGPQIIPEVAIVDCEGSGEVEFYTSQSRKCSRDLFYILVRHQQGSRRVGFFYFDESMHPRGQFVLGAFVYSEQSLDAEVSRSLRHVGLKPGVDEYKSGLRADQHPVQVTLRGRLRRLFTHHEVRLGLVVSPLGDQPAFASDVLHCLSKLATSNKFESKKHEVYFDEGVFQPPSRAGRLRQAAGLADTIILHPSNDSRVVGGIQAADLASHTMATMLLEQLGHVSKKVKAGPHSGYDPDLEFELGFELWASLRYSFFKRAFPAGEDAPPNPLLDVSSCGLYVSERCDEALADAAHMRFDKVYLGCIH